MATIRTLPFAALLLTASVAGAANVSLHQSGYVLDASDNPVPNGNLALKFRLLTAPTGGSEVWSSGPSACSVPVASGYYAVALGTECGTGLSDTFVPAWLEVSIDDTVLEPRVAISAVPAASLASNALALGGVPAGNLLSGTGQVLATALPTGAGGVPLLDAAGKLAPGLVPDASIGNAQIAATAAIAVTKLASGSPSQVLTTNASGVPAWITPVTPAQVTVAAGAPGAGTCGAGQDGQLWFDSTIRTLSVCTAGSWLGAGGTRPAQVTNVVATATTGARVNLTWNAATDAQTYKVLSSTDGTNFGLAATGLTGTSYTVNGLVELVTYTFRVVGVNTAGDGPASNVATATTTASAFGNGADGAITVAATFDLNTGSLVSGRTFADGVAYKVAANPTSNVISLTAPASGIAAGDRVLLANLQGTAANHGDTGNFEILRVTAVSGTNVTVSQAPTRTYAGTGFATQKVVLQRVPQYSNVTISGSGVITAAAWDGLQDHGGAVYTGVVAFTANGTLTVGGGGIDVTAKGFRGGVVSVRSAEDAWNETLATGGTDGTDAPYTGGSDYSNVSGADGGQASGTTGLAGRGGSEGHYGHRDRGGFGYRGGGGGVGHYSTTGPSFGAGGGGTYDSGKNYATADKVTLGGGAAQGGGGGGGGQCYVGTVPARGGKRDGTGGAGHHLGNGKRGGHGGAGQNGGGVVLVWAQTLAGTGQIRAVGGAGGAGGGGGGGGSHYGGGGGGGGGANGAAGGTVYVRYGTNSGSVTTGVAGGTGGGGGGGGSSGDTQSYGAGGGGGAGPGGGGGGGGGYQNTPNIPGGQGGDGGLVGFDGTSGGSGGRAGGGGGGGDTNGGGQANQPGCCSRGTSSRAGIAASGRNGGAGGWGQHAAAGGGGAQGEDGQAGVATVAATAF